MGAEDYRGPTVGCREETVTTMVTCGIIPPRMDEMRYVPAPVLEQSSTVATVDIGHWHNIASLIEIQGVSDRPRRRFRWATSVCRVSSDKSCYWLTPLSLFYSISRHFPAPFRSLVFYTNAGKVPHPF